MNEWIPCNKKLPNNNDIVLVKFGSKKYPEYEVLRFIKGRTKEEIKNAKVIYEQDEEGNNKKPYIWKSVHTPFSLFGQEVSCWKSILD